jgi:uncharacterized membrane protein HdeD (DUF308 family)
MFLIKLNLKNKVLFMLYFFLLGLIDVIAGLLIIITENLFMQNIAKYIGIIILIKGIWSIITSLRSF